MPMFSGSDVEQVLDIKSVQINGNHGSISPTCLTQVIPITRKFVTIFLTPFANCGQSLMCVNHLAYG